MIMQRQVGVSRTVEVPQIHFLVPFEDIPVVQQRRVQLSPVGLPFMVAKRFDGFFGLLAIFRAPPGCPGVERQFSEPSMVKSSLPSRALAQNHP